MWDFHRISAEARDHTENSQNAAIPADPLFMRLASSDQRMNLLCLDRFGQSEFGAVQH